MVVVSRLTGLVSFKPPGLPNPATTFMVHCVVCTLAVKLPLLWAKVVAVAKSPAIAAVVRTWISFFILWSPFKTGAGALWRQLLVCSAFDGHSLASGVEKFLRLDQQRLQADYGFLAMKKCSVSRSGNWQQTGKFIHKGVIRVEHKNFQTGLSITISARSRALSRKASVSVSIFASVSVFSIAGLACSSVGTIWPGARLRSRGT